MKKIPGASLKGTGSTTLEHSSTRCSAGQMCATILIIAKSLLEEPRALWTLWYEFFSCDRYGTGNNLIQKEEAIPISFKALQQNRKYGKLQYEKIRNGFFFRKSYKSLFFPAKKITNCYWYQYLFQQKSYETLPRYLCFCFTKLQIITL